MKKVVLTPKIAQEIQDEIFSKMTAEEKIKMVSQFFEFGKKLNKIGSQKINGNRGTSYKNREDFRKN